MTIQDWPVKVLFKGQRVTHRAKKKKLFVREILVTACGLRGELTDLNNATVPQTCDGCLQVIYHGKAR